MPQYWLQYHNFEKEGAPGVGAINTNKDEFKLRFRFNQDVILLVVGLDPKPYNLTECGISPSILSKVDLSKKLYFIWEKFIASNYEDFGTEGFRYELYGPEENCVVYDNPPIILKSDEFRDFWTSHRYRGFICLSDYGCPFPELEEIGEGLIFRRGKSSIRSNLSISGRITVSPEVEKGLNFVRQKLLRHQLSDLKAVDNLLRQYGYKTTAEWIISHPREYFDCWKFGFNVQSN